jgi:hypothetical protein
VTREPWATSLQNPTSHNGGIPRFIHPVEKLFLYGADRDAFDYASLEHDK